MNILTKFSIGRPAHEVFEAFVDPAKIGNFWFSSSSDRWEAGKTITLRYEEYNATVVIKVKEVERNQKIVFVWEGPGEEHVVTIALQEVAEARTVIEVNEEGFSQDDPEFVSKLVDNKEGWVFVLTCLKAYLEFGVKELRAGLVK
ncbi:SRPBCC family protein [Brevibacillus reuszeri]|uniref:SRPBCC family protein n=1 Tax=Brevibacillus reuszeri TaxID=54915 RepID=UPI000CCBE421|nr:SRPBCC family protein [Brevibacillus reuszeri]